jgi:hypothetical protein
MAKCISGHSAYKSATAMAMMAIPVVPPLREFTVVGFMNFAWIVFL